VRPQETKESRTRRDEALALANELLTDIELGRLKAMDVARRASRLARLMDDADAQSWLAYETSGYPKPLTAEATAAAIRSSRQAEPAEDGSARYWVSSVSEFESEADGALAQIAAAAGSGTSNSQWAVTVEQQKAQHLSILRKHASSQRAIVDRVVGSIHSYVARCYDELRFGASVGNAFEVVRSEVDGAVGALVPQGLGMISAAFENAASENPEHWANAAGTCRRLLKMAADQVRPAGDPIRLASGQTVKMGPDNYINRLVAWVNEQAQSETSARMIAADLEYLGRRLDAADRAGQKGAHDQVTRYDASRFITGTYLVLGDLLRLQAGDSS
jgi:hypothetical protein